MADTPKTAEPLLDLSTLIERPTIAVDGERYEILSPDELSAIDNQMFAAKGRRIDDLIGKTSLSEKEKQELTRIVAEVADRVMVGVPETVRAKLSDAHRFRIVEVFTQLPLQRRLKDAAAGAAAPANAKSTGGRKRRGSRGSTAATRGAGSPTSPSPSSGPASQ